MPEALAAVARAPHAPMLIERVFLDDPRPNELLVEVRASGICHTDLSGRDEHTPFTLPGVVGHEGAGIVRAVGAEVTTVRVGDRVVMSQAFCGECEYCQAGEVTACRSASERSVSGVRSDGSTLILDQSGQSLSGSFLGQSSLATYALVREPNVVLIPDDLPWEIAAPMACAVQTGVGLILNVLKPSVSDAIAVFGAGTVGLSVVLGAAYVGCETIIVVDPQDDRLELAMDLGATHTIDPRTDDPVTQIREITGGGTNFSVEASGALTAGPAAVESLDSRGCCVLLGAPPFGTKLELDWIGLVSGRTVRGANYGGGNPASTIAKLLQMRAAGALPIERLVQTYPFSDIARAVADMESGSVIKPVLLAEEDLLD